MAQKNKRGKLLLASPVYDRLSWEVSYLNLSGRHYVPEEGEIVKSTADLIRYSVALFVDWMDAGGVGWTPIEREESRSFSFWFGQLGLWDYAIGRHYASSYHDLATQALYWRFCRIDERAEQDQVIWERLEAMNSDDLVHLFRHGGLHAL